MDYGRRAPHIASERDLTILHCYACGWFSEELTQQQMHDRGFPWYCDQCGKQGLRWVRFAPEERAEARYEIGLG